MQQGYKKHKDKRKDYRPMLQLSKRADPVFYSVELVDLICLRIALGEVLWAICKDEDMPQPTSFLKWVLEDRDGLREKYDRARYVQLDAWADEMFTISNTPHLGVKTVEKVDAQGNVSIDRSTYDMVDHRRLQIFTRQWLLSRLDPARFGERSKTELTGKDGKDLIPDGGLYTAEQRVAALTALLNAVRARIPGPDPSGAEQVGAAGGSADSGVLIEG